MDILQKAFRQYESAMGSAAATGDRLCQMEAMDGAARCLEALRLQHKICNCRPLEFNTRLLEVASSVGAKVNCQCKSRISLVPIHGNTRDGDEEKKREARRTVKSISSLFATIRELFFSLFFSRLRLNGNSKRAQ